MPSSVTFEHYEVMTRDDGSLCELGRGAMGITYKGLDTRLRVPVALKVINAAHLHSEKARQRFVREARSAAKLRHRNVASVFHLGQEDDNYFYAMEFIDGETVDAQLKRQGPFAISRALQIAGQVARALNAAQTHDLVHRDIKPANLMLVNEDDELVVKVIDFGLAKVSLGGDEDAAPLTISGFLGTPHFASPEQLEEREIDVRSDIYSLGVTLWFMLTGKPPFSGSVVQVMSQHISRQPPFEELAGIPEPVVKVLRRMLEKSPADRPQTAADLRREIERCQRMIDQTAIAADERPVRVEPVEISETAPTESEETQFATGAAVGERFLITEHVGENEAGILFRAHDNRENRDVRLLVLDREILRDNEVLAQLERDSERLTAVANPHVLQVIGLETSGLDCYLTLEWIDGFSLRDLLRARRELALSEVLKLLPQAAEGLDAALAANLEYIEVGLPQMFVHFADDGVAPESFLRRPVGEWPEFAVKFNALAISRDRLGATWAGDRTMVGGPRGNGREHAHGDVIRDFGAIIYELLGGVPTAVSRERYTPLASVGEAGNAILRKSILTPESFGSASEFARLLASPPGITKPPPARTAAVTSTPEVSPTEAPVAELRAGPTSPEVIEKVPDVAPPAPIAPAPHEPIEVSAPPIESVQPVAAPVEESPLAEPASAREADVIDEVIPAIDSPPAAVVEAPPIVEPEPVPAPLAEEPPEHTGSVVPKSVPIEPAPVAPRAEVEPQKFEEVSNLSGAPPPPLPREERETAAPSPTPRQFSPPVATPPTRSSKRRLAMISGAVLVLLIAVPTILHFTKDNVPVPVPPTPSPEPVPDKRPEPIPEPPVPPSPTREDIVKEKRIEADALEAKQANREALQVWLELARDYQEFDIGKAGLDSLVNRLRTRPGGLSRTEFETMRGEITQAAQLDVLPAMLLLGDQLRKTDPAASFAWFCAAAEKDNAQAMTEAGLRIFSADGVPRDDKAAIYYLERAAALDQPRAIAALATCYLDGRGITPDPKRGVELLKKAAELGDTAAMINLARAYQQGLAKMDGKTPDEEALHWFSEAADRGSAKALGNLGALLIKKALSEKNRKTVETLRASAVEKFKEGIAKGDAGSMYYYAGSLSEGWGVPRKDPKEAVAYYQKAAEKYRETASNNDIDSMFYYASSLENIDDLEKSIAHREEIRKWYKMAAEAGHERAADWCKRNQVLFTPPK